MVIKKVTGKTINDGLAVPSFQIPEVDSQENQRKQPNYLALRPTLNAFYKEQI